MKKIPDRQLKKLPICKLCGSIGHYKTFCFLNKKKVPSKVGKYTKKWFDFRKEYLKNHPPDRYGFYTCYLCYKKVPAKEITLDHVIARSKAPKLRYNESNIRFCCSKCNYEKGSKTY